jgi:coenzyme PQQ precursor peptide PqqA
MSEIATTRRKPGQATREPGEREGCVRPAPRWERPAFEVIPLDCEITAYAPAGDDPLF